jgi:hypothetical protein
MAHKARTSTTRPPPLPRHGPTNTATPHQYRHARPQLLCGIAKDLTKLGGKTVTKLVSGGAERAVTGFGGSIVAWGR